MRVCVLTTSFPLYPGDYSGIFVSALVNNLSTQGLKVEVVAPHDKGAKIKEEMSGVRVHRFRYFLPASWQRLAYHGGIVPNLRKSIMAKIELPFFLSSFVFRSLLVARRCDIIHVHWIHNGLIALICQLVFKKPVILTAHGPDINYLQEGGLIAKVARFILKKVDKVITVSDSIKKKVIAFGASADKVITIPNGVPDQNTFLNLPPKDGVDYSVLFVGRLVPQKNVQFLLKAINLLKNKLPEIKLVIVGDGPQRGKLEDYVRKKSLEKQVSFEGAKPREKIYDYFQKADLFVLPSTIEGLPIVILEALAAGKPIITTPVEGVPEIIKNGENGLIVESNDVNELANSVIKLFEDKSLRDRLIANSRKTIRKKYNWADIAQHTKDIYKTVPT